MTRYVKTIQEKIISDIRETDNVEELQRVGRALTKEVASHNLKVSIECGNTYDFARNNRYAMQLSSLLTQELSSQFLGLTL